MSLCHYREISLDLGVNGTKAWAPATPTKKLVQRQLVLMVCGWSLKEDDFSSVITRSVLLLAHGPIQSSKLG